MILQAVDGRLNFGGGHLIQSHLAEFADQIGSEVGVAFERLRSAAATRMFREPMLEILSEQGPGTLGCILRRAVISLPICTRSYPKRPLEVTRKAVITY